MRTPGRSTWTVRVTGCWARSGDPMMTVSTHAASRAAVREIGDISRYPCRGGALRTVPVLQVEGISKRFPGVTALDAVALEVAAGEVVALVGENGAGKSTLMKILAGVYRPDEGEIRIDGHAIVFHSPSDATRLGVGVIHQELEVVDTLDVAANIGLGREPVWGGPLRLLDRQRLEATADAALARLGLTLPARMLVRHLSTAQRQLLTIARALAMQARILILDEPTSSLTLEDTNRLLQVIRDLQAQGVAIIYISHRLAEVESIADRVVVLRDGRNAGMLARDAINRDVVIGMMVKATPASQLP